MLKKDHVMKDKKRAEILLKFIKKIWNKNHKDQDLSRGKHRRGGYTWKEVKIFILLFFAVVFIVLGYPNRNLKIFFVCGGNSLWKF